MTSNLRNMHPLPCTIRFFKIITKTILEDGKLRIPNGFTRKYGDHMPNPLFLKAPNGKEWNIYWTKNDGDIWFQKGWKEFATHYSLDHGHMVLFEYEETCHFGVHIFDKSTLEIEYHFHSSQDEHNNNLDRISEDSDSVEILDELPPCKRTRSKSQISCPQPHKKLRTDSGEDGGRNSKLQNFPRHVQVKEDAGGSTAECLKVEQEQFTSKITEALNRASNNFRSKNPSFAVAMKPSYLHNSFLHVPSEFAKVHLKKGQNDILLQVMDGRTWPSKYCLGRISIGWKKFVSDNNLKVGDVCVFELTNCQTLTFKVLIFQLVPAPQEPVQEVDPLDPARIPYVESKTFTTNKGRFCCRTTGGKATKRTSPRTSEVVNEAKKFTSENPFFMVNINPRRKGRIYRPHIPSAFMRKYLDKRQIVILQFWKELWPVSLNYCSRSSSPRLSRGWALFGAESKLKAGDACVFELINREDAVLDVHIFRGHS